MLTNAGKNQWINVFYVPGKVSIDSYINVYIIHHASWSLIDWDFELFKYNFSWIILECKKKIDLKDEKLKDFKVMKLIMNYKLNLIKIYNFINQFWKWSSYQDVCKLKGGGLST